MKDDIQDVVQDDGGRTGVVRAALAALFAQFVLPCVLQTAPQVMRAQKIHLPVQPFA
ncbi:hypothetical protein SAV14893_032870 [Streptomyces avermitilis]|uniref:Uncharacterized protein n=1 Tax=Streptomyces avermitilis TaxID=33903 RepID=A0A4D4MUW6_STRAX|nr:hypothetical protein SAVMC3_44780 [Streptomyces avermitilis]GDY63894.1 hypothetical protein SAV14893_032870 [Streptomyces avermitilis]GDY75960.1 hypothetical protein SAV31267_054450 [Streptomyces avermitilis]GDY84923.1 hypothetical protein SAVCW2_41220 [Streptomyces avermitilis]